MANLTTAPQEFVAARPSRLHKVFWRRYFARSLRRHFHSGFVAGEEHIIPEASVGKGAQLPTIFACTHASWWDAALTIELSLGQYKLDAYGMMEYKQLRKYSFFSRIGMFSVVREEPASALYSLRYAASLLRDSTKSLWMFPQGELIHQDMPTLSCEPGIGILASYVGACRIVPVAMRYEQLREQRPSVWVRIGSPFMVDGSKGVREITGQVSQNMMDVRDHLRLDAMQEDHSAYRTFLNGSMSMEKRFDKIMRR
jgi:1-acyl-sn-glycerol-3-phosphate acyltransferase